MAESLVVQSKVREMFKELDCNTGSDAIDQLNKEVERIVKRAVERTKENGRKTVKAADI
jgi:histone H3/H4